MPKIRANSMSDAALLIRALFLDFRPEALLGGGLYELGLTRKTAILLAMARPVPFRLPPRGK